MNRGLWGLIAVTALVACGDVADSNDATSITGRVLDENGAPIVAAEVSTLPTTQTVLTGADGRFRIDGARFTVSYVVSAEKEGFRVSTAVITPTATGANEVNLRLQVQAVCTPGERRCVEGGDEAVQVCNALGNAFGDAMPCAESQSCDPTDGTCKGSFQLTVNAVDAGVVRSAPAGISCGTDCTTRFPEGTQVTLTAIPLSQGTFLGWGDDCETAGTAETCTITLDADRTVSANFSASVFPLRVSRVGTGTGDVTSMPAGIDCGRTCNFNFDRDAQVTLTAVPAEGSEFETWQQNCSDAGSNPTCVLTMDAARNARARFRVLTYSLEVNKAGTGAGTITSDPAGIDCGGTCQTDLRRGITVTLTAVPEDQSNFVEWTGGGCSGSQPTCTFDLNGNTTVGATFDGITYPLNVNVLGAGGGTVALDPSGVVCADACTVQFPPAAAVTLTATPNADSAFDGWAEACAASTGPTCTVTVNQATTASAMFEPFYLFPLLADADCAVGLSFDGANPLAHRCGAAGMATLSGMYRRETSRTAALDQGYIPDDMLATGGLDTGRTLPAPPNATVELTVRRDGNALGGTGRAVLISDVDLNAPVGGFRLLALDDGAVAVQTWQNGRVASTATVANVLPAGQWRHVAATVGAAGLTVFVDGQQRGTQAGAPGWTASSSTAWVGAERFGASSSQHRLNGAFDEVRLSRGVRY